MRLLSLVMPFNAGLIVHGKEYYLAIFSSSNAVVTVMAFNATFNNISAISWRSVLLMEGIGVPGGENHRPAASH